MLPFLRLIGAQALPQYRLSALFKIINSQISKVNRITANFEYFIEQDSSGELSKTEQQLLCDVLDASLPTIEQKRSYFGPSQSALWVLPRLGTQSAWGAKTKDILHHLGLSQVTRIESAIVFHLEGVPQLSSKELEYLYPLIHDKMTQSVVLTLEAMSHLFMRRSPRPLQSILLKENGRKAIEAVNIAMGLALSEQEITYLQSQYQRLDRDPTDVELMMFAQANSEHCRHKIFKARWKIDNINKVDTLFNMIKNTYKNNATGILSAYHDNAAVVQGFGKARFFCNPHNQIFQSHETPVHLLIKVETHNHPTSIEPFCGAGTGQGGEIRDEGATGTGSKPKAGLTGFTVSNLHLPDLKQPWEHPSHYPARIATALDIMLKAPLGGAAFNNEFGRPNLCGYFRTLEIPQSVTSSSYYAKGYHKPIMIAGGVGNICQPHIQKRKLAEGTLILLLGGPCMKIGLGGGGASSMPLGSSSETLDFASVQRQNPEMQRRCQEVIDYCWALLEENPILSIHDVGAGGLANAIPELVNDAKMGAFIELRDIPIAEEDMTPLEIWCNESQERYVLAIVASQLSQFEAIAKRERCPFALIGRVTSERHLTVHDALFQNNPIDIPLSLLFSHVPDVEKIVYSTPTTFSPIKLDFSLIEILQRVLACPCVSDKTFLITIGDRSVGGLVARDQMVGPWQVPVADCAVTATHYSDSSGEAFSMGERPFIAVLDPKAASKMAVAESVLNLLAADIAALSDIRLSCNWMADSQDQNENVSLFHAVEAVGKELCPAWDITVPVGKDSLSMRTHWVNAQRTHQVSSPVTLVVSAFAPVKAIHKTYTPVLNTEVPSVLFFIDLAAGNQRLGGSVFAQVTNQIGVEVPTVDAPEVMKRFICALNQVKKEGWLLAYHDRSDGGLWVTLCEMAFASHCGLRIDLSAYAKQNSTEAHISALLNEELGVVLQVPLEAASQVKAIFSEQKIVIYTIANLQKEPIIELFHGDNLCYRETRKNLHLCWSKMSLKMRELRDTHTCGKAEAERIMDDSDPGLHFYTTGPCKVQTNQHRDKKPKIAILREQGVNGHLEMAAAFTLAGFEAHNVTMQDLLEGATLEPFQGMAVCGGFSYGDVLGAGAGWAKTILHHARLSALFHSFFSRSSTFTLGVCNGCQMLSRLVSLIPGAEGWPYFKQNTSLQFEARCSLVEILPSASILLKGMQGWRVPVVVSHGEGCAYYNEQDMEHKAFLSGNVALRYVDNYGQVAEHYPANPNGSPLGVTGFTSRDGRVTIMMPHPERVFKPWQFSWVPPQNEEESPWMQLFYNAYNWVK